MTDEEADEVRVWLVDREHTDKGMVTTTYATPDGERKHVEQFSANSPREVTAAKAVPTGRLAESADDEVERYAQEAERMTATHDPDDVV